MFQKKSLSAFTFIEIMIVITIIATLASVAFFSYIQFSKKSRDTLRLSNVKEIQGGLEVYAIKTKKYPTPDTAVQGNISYNGNSFAYSKVGFVKKDVASALNLKSVPIDPVYQKEIQYATLDNGKRYQLSTVLESMFSSNNKLTQQTYATTQIAKLQGNYNGRFIKVSSGSTHTVISLPSLFLNNGSGSLNIAVDQPVQNILVSGAPGSIDILNNVNGNTFSYTPKVVYSSKKCGVETDQEIVDFLLNLREAYNQAPFTGLEEFRDIFADFESIGANGKSADDVKMGMSEIDFSTLERIGSKINDALGCEIKNFKTTDIFPETCENNGITESGDFEGYPHGFSMTGSCLFTVTGNGTAEIRNSVGKDNSKGFYIKNNSGELKIKYTTFSYIPAKLSFDFKTFFDPGYTTYGGLTININGSRYKSWNRDNNSAGYTSFTTEVMPPGLYTFEFVIGQPTYLKMDYVHLDNIIFGCKRMGELSGESNCGRTLDFEEGEKMPWELFSFTGEVKTPWPRDNSPGASSNGNYALTSPNYLISYKSFSMIRNETFTQPAKYNFDYKGIFGSTSSGDDVKLLFLINGIEYLSLSSKDTNSLNYRTFTTPLLPEGAYIFEWKVSRGNTSQIATYYIDNIRKSCDGGGAGCGRSLGFQDGNLAPYDLFSFTGTHFLPWPTSGSGGTYSEGTHGLPSPKILNGKNLNLYMNRVFIQPQRMNFYIKTDLSSQGNIRFYINNVEYKIFNDGEIADSSNFVKISTPVLPAGNYSFRWYIYGGSNSGHFAQMYLDDFSFDCVGGGTNCGVINTQTSSPLDIGDTLLTDIFTFTGYANIPWEITSFTGEFNQGTSAIKSPIIAAGTNTTLTMLRTFSQPQKLNFDFKYRNTSQGNITFFINGIEYEKYGSGNTNFSTYSSPLLPAGNYEFKWYLHGGTNSNNNSQLFLDNFIFNCVGGGTNCGITTFTGNNNSLELGSYSQTDIFSFTGFVNIPWKHVSGSGNTSNGLHALQSPIVSQGKTSNISLNMTFSQAQRFNFDIKPNLSSNANITFYINDAKYDFYTSALNNSFSTFKTPLLAPGNYNFRWEMSVANTFGHFAQMTLDNLLLDCVGGGTNCGITNFVANSNSLEIGDTPIYNIFTASGYAQTPWIVTSGASNVSNGTYALKSPSVLNGKKSELILTINLPVAKKFRYSLKPNITANGTVKFYYNSVLNNSYTSSSSKTFGTITTPTLGVGTHTFRWLIEAGTYNVDDFAEIILDNLQFID